MTVPSVTLLNAQNHGGGGWFDTPRYVAHGAVLGTAHVTGEDQLYSAVRFRLDHRYWLGHLVEREPTVLTDDKSTLSVEISADGNWLVYCSSTPATLRQLQMRVVSGSTPSGGWAGASSSPGWPPQSPTPTTSPATNNCYNTWVNIAMDTVIAIEPQIVTGIRIAADNP